jgi:hypothetical protein
MPAAWHNAVRSLDEHHVLGAARDRGVDDARTLPPE